MLRNVLRRYWLLWLLAVVVLILTIIFGDYLIAHQTTADERAEKQRQAICAILANIPGHIPAEIAKARVVFARPGHLGDCQPIVRPTSKPLVSRHPTPTATVIVVRPAAPPTPAPTVSRPTPRPTPSRTATPHPSPSPTQTPPTPCLPILCR